MLKKVSPMSLQGASLAVQLEKQAEAKEKCTLPYVQSAEYPRKFRFCRKTTDLFVAASASKHVGNYGMFVVA